ncbi:hypothetical protein [Bradyrhizobium elkanii]|uniref:hypothetical protein n=1 Tax=Bradyrhizobium elkanii TaxID=29448 RepID=UPI002168D2B3|nr:hypothetical protein [Bradyrhizobium elkanii]MCS3689386.1 hypothetical protein [Bradyrhizobium elkanii]
MSRFSHHQRTDEGDADSHVGLVAMFTITNLASTATTPATVAKFHAAVYGIWKSLTAIAAATMMVKIRTFPSDWVRTNIWDDAGRAEDMDKAAVQHGVGTA